MSSEKIRRQVAFEAARLMYEREESEYFRAKLKAARRIARGDFKPSDLPSNREIRDQIRLWAELQEGERRTDNLRDMRLEALRMMRVLKNFRPRLIGSTLTGPRPPRLGHRPALVLRQRRGGRFRARRAGAELRRRSGSRSASKAKSGSSSTSTSTTASPSS